MCMVILGVGVRGTHPLEIFSAKIAIFESFIDISSLNDHKNFGGQYRHPQGAQSPLKFFFAILYRMTNLTWSTKFGAGPSFFQLYFAFNISDLPYKHPLIITGAP